MNLEISELEEIRSNLKFKPKVYVEEISHFVVFYSKKKFLFSSKVNFEISLPKKKNFILSRS